MKKKKLLLIISVCLLFIIMMLFVIKGDSNITYLTADSGFDSDWLALLSPLLLIFSPILLLAVIITIIVSYSLKKTKEIANHEKPFVENETAIKIISKELPNFNKDDFYKEIFNNFVTIRTSYSNFKYDELKELLTEELYDRYNSLLKKMESKNKKNILKDFTLNKIVLDEFKVTNENYVFKLRLDVSYIDYLITKKGTIIDGSDTNKTTSIYKLIFNRSFKSHKYILDKEEITSKKEENTIEK